MKTRLMLLGAILVFFGCQPPQVTQVSSPDNNIKVNFELKEGKPLYSVDFKGKKVILPSAMGFAFRDMESLDGNFEIETSEQFSLDETWEQLWGEKKFVRNHYKLLW